MKLGYYYHVPCRFTPDGGAMIQSVFGRFIGTLARMSGDEATVFAHGADAAGELEDMTLGPPIVRWVDLGPRRSAPARLLRPAAALERFRAAASDVDVMFVHGPTPLLPHLVRAAGETPTVLLLWGDFRDWRAQSHFSRWRNLAIRALLALYVRMQRRAASGHLVFANNPALLGSLPGADTRLVTFSTVSAGDGYSDRAPAPWPADGAPLELIYTGRIVRDKGLFEAVRAVAMLRDRGIAARLHIVGWTDGSDPTRNELETSAQELDVGEAICFDGYVPAGPELIEHYRRAHVFVLPTYWDSLPRSLLEAMATGLPAVTTRVGGIAHHLTGERDVLFVPPHDPVALADAIERLDREPSLRTAVAEAGRQWSLRHSIEAECGSILSEASKLVAGPAHRG